MSDITVAQMKIMLDELKENAILSCNAVGNLRVYVDGRYVGFIDFTNKDICADSDAYRHERKA